MPDLVHEQACPAPVAGVDEAGRGPLAGPVVAAAVILPASRLPDGIDDSKRLTASRRAALADAIRACADVGLGIAEVEEIDQLNILAATMLAMTRAVTALGATPAFVLVDGNRLPRWDWPSRALVGGDRLSLSIAAASIIAKHERDQMMIAADRAYPGYGFAAHKGYGSAVHMAALRTLGPTPLHRTSFAPVAAALQDVAGAG